MVKQEKFTKAAKKQLNKDKQLLFLRKGGENEIIMKNNIEREYKLTKSQQHVYDCLVAYIYRYGFSPSVRDLCELTGRSSTKTINESLKIIERKGYIKRNGSTPRSIVLIKREGFNEY